MKDRLYFNNCLTTPTSDEVMAAMKPYLLENYYPESFNKTGTKIAEQLKEWRRQVAETIGAEAEEIHFTSGGTIANNLAIKGYLLANADKGNHIICSVIDYPDILANAAFFESSGYEVTYLKADKEGFIDLDQLEKSIKPETILFITTLVNHTVGTIQPMQRIKKILDKAGHKIAVHADACEAYGRIPVNITDMGIDMMSVSGHKIYGPQGSGFLYVNKKIKLAQLIHGITRLDDLQTGGISVANIAGLVKAIELIFKDFDAFQTHLKKISSYFLEKVRKEIPYTIINGTTGDNRAPHNLNITFEYIEGEAIMMMLDYHNISVATGSACASQGLKPNYVLQALGKTLEQSHGSIKFTFSRYTTIEQIDQLIATLKEVVSKLREHSTLQPD